MFEEKVASNPCKMFEDMEDASDVDEDFFDALTLLHSTDDDSSEKLRKMLDASIERKHGFDKTLLARMPKKFLQNTKIRGRSFSNDKLEKRGVGSRKRANVSKTPRNLTLFVNNTTRNDWIPIKTFDAEIEDYSDKGDIPRISIPDEGSVDGLLCKVCNGAKLGPLILLECQECQEVYHPLCHQPLVVDIDVYDPRIVWRCSKCTDVTSVNSAVATDEKKSKKFRQQSDTGKIKESSMKIMSGKLEANFSKSETGAADQIPLDCFQKTSCTGEGVHVKSSTQLIPKVTKTVPSNHLRKRIGSKLSVTRSINKQ